MNATDYLLAAEKARSNRVVWTYRCLALVGWAIAIGALL